MFDVSQTLHVLVWPAIVLFVIVAVGIVIVELLPSREVPLSYIRKKFLFDAKTELELFNTLKGLYGDTYHIFPQVHYSHLLEPNKALSFRDRLVLRNKVDRKSADFVLCDKEKVEVRLVIELDGSSHEIPKRKERDEFINTIAGSSDLPLLHLRTERMERDYIRTEIDRKLATSAPVSPK